MSLESSLLWDITVLDGNDSSHLEDWLTDIKTAPDLIHESRTKLAQEKSKGLIRTLISEAITSIKTWEEIKYCLHLKICNSDIHMSVSHFMEIQQKEKESLVAYIHHFKSKASRCKFDNDAATIRIFIKGLRNAHTLSTRVYEKGSQSLVDAIKEEEKLQAAQQLTATSLPSSSVNTMSNDDDKCFQHQELGHIACQCPHIKCFNCDEYGHVAADCPDKIPLSGMPARHRNNSSTARWCNRSTSHNNHWDRHHHYDHGDRHRFSRSRSHSHSHNYRINSWSNPWRSCSRSYHWPIYHSTSCQRNSSTYPYRWDTPHRRSWSHRSFSGDGSRSRWCTSHKHKQKTSSKPSYSSNCPAWRNKDRKYKQVTIDDSPSKYYSSDEQASESDKDLN